MSGLTKTQKLRKTIREDLLAQLAVNGTEGGYYTDLVDDYMGLWDAKHGLLQDIRERGVAVEVTTNAGVTNVRKNDSVGELVKVNAQMLKLLDALNIEPGQSAGEEIVL